MTTRVTMSVMALGASLAIVGSTFLAASASAVPVVPDPNQPANGESAPGHSTESTLTPWFSPIQVPPPAVTGGGVRSRTIVYRAYPYLSRWLHDAIGRQPLELNGAARITFVDPVGGRTVVVNPNGHCDFTDGRNLGAGTPLRPIVVDAEGFALTIEPRLHQSAS